MTHSITYTLTRGDEDIDLEIEYSVAAYDPGNTWGLPEDCEPPSGGDIEELEITTVDGKPFQVTPDEQSKIEDHIYQNHDYDRGIHDYEDDYL